MEENQGWIKLHRKFLKWEWYDDINTSRFFLHCLFRANHKDKKWRGTMIKRGQFISSLSKLAKECGLSVRSVRTCISRLKSTHELTHQTTSKYSLITLVNYDKYQKIDTPNDKVSDKQTTNERQANDKQTTTNKNVKNIKNDKECKELKVLPNIYPQIKNLEQIQDLVINFYDYQYQHFPKQLRMYKTSKDKLVADSVQVIDKLIRIDGYTLDEVKLTLQSAVKDDFWQKQIISLKGLRKRSKNGNTKFDNINVKRETTHDEFVENVKKKIQEYEGYGIG